MVRVHEARMLKIMQRIHASDASGFAIFIRKKDGD